MPRVINYDFHVNEPNRHFLPSSIRCLIVGPANCGKTNLLLNFLCNEGWVQYDKLYVYSNTLCQPKYRTLRAVFADLEGELGKEIAVFHSSQADLTLPENLDPTVRNALVFDDVLLDKQNIIERYFAQGRHSNAHVFYCSQSYTRIPKQVVRDNANLLVLFPQDELNMKHIYENHVGGDMDFAEFKATCRSCWERPFGFLTIDKTRALTQGRYKRMFNLDVKEKRSVHGR